MQAPGVTRPPTWRVLTIGITSRRRAPAQWRSPSQHCGNTYFGRLTPASEHVLPLRCWMLVAPKFASALFGPQKGDSYVDWLGRKLGRKLSSVARVCVVLQTTARTWPEKRYVLARLTGDRETSGSPCARDVESTSAKYTVSEHVKQNFLGRFECDGNTDSRIRISTYRSVFRSSRDKAS